MGWALLWAQFLSARVSRPQDGSGLLETEMTMLHRAKPWRGENHIDRKLKTLKQVLEEWGCLRTDQHMQEANQIWKKKQQTFLGSLPVLSYYTTLSWQPMEMAALCLSSIPFTGEWAGKNPQVSKSFKCESQPLAFPSFSICDPSDLRPPFITL